MKNLLDFFANLSGWTKGIISFLTMLVSFVFLFRDNLYLMAILSLLTISLAGLLAAGYIVLSKTPPLISGGKGVYNYPKFRPIAIIVLFFIFISNAVFFTSNFGSNLFKVAIWGTPTLSSPSPMANISATVVSPTATSTTIPSPQEIVKADFYPARCGSGYGRDFLVPNGIEINQDIALDLMDEFYSQKVWRIWKQIPDLNTYTIVLTNVIPDSGIVIIDNTAYVNVETYEPLKHINIANFSQGAGYFIGDDPCGGGWSSEAFDIALLRPGYKIEAKTKQFDYFTIQPGEQEEFTIKIMCAEPGLYIYHIELDVSYFGNKRRLQVSPSITAYCPESYSLLMFTDVTNADLSNQNFEPHTVSFLGEYKLSTPEKSKLSLDPSNDWKEIYSLSEPIIYWAKTRPWTPCSNAFESFIYPEGNGYDDKVIVNPTLDTPVNIRAKPSINSKIVKKVLPGQVLRFYEFECAGGYVWWQVEGQSYDGIYSGWIAELTEETTILQPCFRNFNCDGE